MPITLVKSTETDPATEPDMLIAGIASTDDKDRQGDNLDQMGLNVAPFLKTGFLNYDHDDEKLVGIPIPDECKFTDRGFFITAKLLPNKLGKEIYENAKALKRVNSDRQYGFSVQGTIDKRDAVTNRVTKATVYHVAITPTPQNPECSWEVLQKSFAGYQTPVGDVNSGASLKNESLEKDEVEPYKLTYKDFRLLAESNDPDAMANITESLKHAKYTKENAVKLLLINGSTFDKAKEIVNYLEKGGYNMRTGKELMDNLENITEALNKSINNQEEIGDENLEKSKKTETPEDKVEDTKASEISEGADNKIEEETQEEQEKKNEDDADKEESEKEENNEPEKKEDEAPEETEKKDEEPEKKDDENLEKSKETEKVPEDETETEETTTEDAEELVKSLMTQPAIQAIANLVAEQIQGSIGLITPMAKSISASNQLNAELYRNNETLIKSVGKLEGLLQKSIDNSELSLEAVNGVTEELSTIKDEVAGMGRVAHLRKSVGATQIADKNFDESSATIPQEQILTKSQIASVLLNEVQSGNTNVTVADVMTAEAGGNIRPDLMQLVKSKLTGKIG